MLGVLSYWQKTQKSCPLFSSSKHEKASCLLAEKQKIKLKSSGITGFIHIYAEA